MTQREWICGGCGITHRHIGGEPLEKPKGFEDGRCIDCRLAALPDPDEKAKLMLLAGYRVRQVTARLASSERRVIPLAKELGLAVREPKHNNDDLFASDAKRPTEARKSGAKVERVERVEAALREDCNRSNSEVAGAADASATLVFKVRKRLGLPRYDRGAALRGRIEEALKADPGRSVKSVAEDLGTSQATVRKVKRALKEAKA